MIRTSSLILAALLLAGCSGEDPALSCSGNGGCSRGEYCSADGQCLALEDNSFVGTFGCVPAGAQDTPVTRDSDVVGKLFGQDVTLNGFGLCYVGNGYIFAAQGTDHTALSISSLDPGPQNELSNFNILNDNFAVVGGDGVGNTSPVLLYIDRGNFSIDVRPEIGAEVKVRVEVHGVPAAQQQAAGSPCPQGNECGPYFISGAACARSESDTFCTADCSVDGDCTTYGADVCSDGVCYRSCSADTECNGQQRCLLAGERNVCR